MAAKPKDQAPAEDQAAKEKAAADKAAEDQAPAEDQAAKEKAAADKAAEDQAAALMANKSKAKGKDEKKKYIAKTNICYDSDQFAIGDEIELTDKAAAPLLAVGAIEKFCD